MSTKLNVDASGDKLHKDYRVVSVQKTTAPALGKPDYWYRHTKVVAIYSKTATQLGDLRNRIRHPHPWFGSLDVLGWHALAEIRNGFHRRQIEMIVRSRSKMGMRKGIS